MAYTDFSHRLYVKKMDSTAWGKKGGDTGVF